MASERREGDGVKAGERLRGTEIERARERHMQPHLNVGHAQCGDEADKIWLIKTDSEKQRNETEYRKESYEIEKN